MDLQHEYWNNYIILVDTIHILYLYLSKITIYGTIR